MIRLQSVRLTRQHTPHIAASRKLGLRKGELIDASEEPTRRVDENGQHARAHRCAARLMLTTHARRQAVC